MSENNKEFIAETALGLFARKGYEGVGVQEICQASGITKPTLYHYFKSKRGLLEYLTETYGMQLCLKIEEALTYNHDFINSLTKVLKTEIEFALEQRNYFYFHTLLLNSPEGSEQHEVYERIQERITKAYQEFFQLSCNEFGNMRGKEILYSKLFRNNVVSTASICAANIIKYDDETVYRIIHSTVYGFAS